MNCHHLYFDAIMMILTLDLSLMLEEDVGVEVTRCTGALGVET
jgi:hypothetical protein